MKVKLQPVPRVRSLAEAAHVLAQRKQALLRGPANPNITAAKAVTLQARRRGKVVEAYRVAPSQFGSVTARKVKPKKSR